jgi:hypothetical protein
VYDAAMHRAALVALALSASSLACGGAAPQGPEPAVPTSSAAAPSPPPPPTSAPEPTAAPPPPGTSADAGAATPPGRPTSAGRIRFVGGDGTSEAQAVVIDGARGEQDGVASEYAWLDQVYGSRMQGGYRVLKQALRGSGGKHYDVLTVEAKDGTRTDVWFDISGYFGKF